MPRLKEWYDPAIHLPHGVVAAYESPGGNPFITNAKPELVSTTRARRLGDVTIRLEDAAFVTEGHPVDPWVLRACGFDSRTRPNRSLVDGKFVFHKDGTFFLAANGIVHSDLPECINVYDPVAILSAGFINLTADQVNLHGESISLRKKPYFGTPYDRQVISAYFGIPFALTEEEFL